MSASPPTERCDEEEEDAKEERRDSREARKARRKRQREAEAVARADNKVKVNAWLDAHEEEPADEAATPPPKQKKKDKGRKGGAEAEANGGGDAVTFVVEQTLPPLGHKRRLTVDKFQGRLCVNIREYYEDAEGVLKPTKKGVALSPEQWRMLYRNGDKVKELLDHYESR